MVTEDDLKQRRANQIAIIVAVALLTVIVLMFVYM
jgi:hypothetical protein